ncbi:hypothetical protein FMN50_08440 [Rhodobacterales bacterium]|nr:hypothetical protein FMN50_08440 [Rhodobacterales bacterium]
MKYFSCVAHTVVFGLLEEGSGSDYSKYELTKDSSAIGFCEFPSHLPPRFSVSEDGSFAVYAGCNAYFVTKKQSLIHIEEKEEISNIWFLDGFIIVKCETLFIKMSLSELRIQREYWHEEIITAALLMECGAIAFQDLNNGVYELNLDDFSVKSSTYPFDKLS